MSLHVRSNLYHPENRGTLAPMLGSSDMTAVDRKREIQ